MQHIVAAGAYSSQPSFDLSLTVNLCRASLRVVPAALDEITHRCRATFIWCASSAAHRRRATFPTASHHYLTIHALVNLCARSCSDFPCGNHSQHVDVLSPSASWRRREFHLAIIVVTTRSAGRAPPTFSQLPLSLPLPRVGARHGRRGHHCHHHRLRRGRRHATACVLLAAVASTSTAAGTAGTVAATTNAVVTATATAIQYLPRREPMPSPPAPPLPPSSQPQPQQR